MEFEDKSVAKSVALMLNGNQIGGKKRSAYYYDLWNVRWVRIAVQVATSREPGRDFTMNSPCTLSRACSLAARACMLS